MADLLAAIALAGNLFDVNGTNISVLTLTGGTAPSGDGDSVRTTRRYKQLVFLLLALGNQTSRQ